MTYRRMHARLFAPTLALCLSTASCLSTHAQEPTATPPPAATQKPAPIVRATPKPTASTSASPQQFGASSSDAPPKPIHLTVAKPVVKAPSMTKPDGTPVAPAPKPVAAKSKPAVSKAAKPAGPPANPGTALIAINRTVILLDAAHGGPDFGSHISDSIAEKDVTLALAFKLRSLLAARGFTVVMTRDNDAAQSAPGTTLTLDDRAGVANHSHPVACLLLHATASGEGVHLYTSELDPVPAEPATNPWLTAQAAWVPASQALGNQLGVALARARLPLVQSRASVRPVDSLTCPAVVLELAPESSGNSSSLSDGAYQQRVAEAVAASLVFWQNQAQPPVRIVPLPPPPPPAQAATPDPATPGAQP